MATICTVLGCSHSPFLFMPPELWDEVRRRRQLAKDVPRPSVETNKAEFERCMKAYATLKQKIEAVKPDVLLIFGDDQRDTGACGDTASRLGWASIMPAATKKPG